MESRGGYPFISVKKDFGRFCHRWPSIIVLRGPRERRRRPMGSRLWLHKKGVETGLGRLTALEYYLVKE